MWVIWSCTTPAWTCATPPTNSPGPPYGAGPQGTLACVHRWAIPLRGIGGGAEASVKVKGSKKPDPEDDEAYPPYANDADPWKAHFAEIDALLARTSKVLAGETPLPKSGSHLVYDPDQDEAEDLLLDVVQRTSAWPAIAAAAVVWNAWLDLNHFTRLPWLG